MGCKTFNKCLSHITFGEGEYNSSGNDCDPEDCFERASFWRKYKHLTLELPAKNLAIEIVYDGSRLISRLDECRERYIVGRNIKVDWDKPEME
jgi:hypothetical protein